MAKKRSSLSPLYFRNFVFGVEDGLVSTVGFLSGVAAAGVSQSTLLLTGMVLIFVEAISMAIGSYLSEDTIEESQHIKQASMHAGLGALVMFVSYFLSGLIPLSPYLFSYTSATFAISVTLSLVVLVGLGVVSARIYKISLIKSGLRMLVLGGFAIAVGVAVGRLIHF